MITSLPRSTRPPSPHPLVPVSPQAVLSVRVVTRGQDLIPRIAYVYPTSAHTLEAHEVYAVEHGLTSLVWSASRDQGWDVRPVHGHDERGHYYAGAELVLDVHTYEAARVGERVLADVALALEVGS